MSSYRGTYVVQTLMRFPVGPEGPNATWGRRADLAATAPGVREDADSWAMALPGMISLDCWEPGAVDTLKIGDTVVITASVERVPCAGE